MSIQTYIDQLCQELQETHTLRQPDINYRELFPDHAAPEGMEYVIAWEVGERFPFVDIFGFDSEKFPAPESLTACQCEQLNEAILALWNAHSIGVNSPIGAPSDLLYEALLKVWREENILPPQNDFGHTTIELCDYEPDTCIWGRDLCECAEFDEEED